MNMTFFREVRIPCVTLCFVRAQLERRLRFFFFIPRQRWDRVYEVYAVHHCLAQLWNEILSPGTPLCYYKGAVRFLLTALIETSIVVSMVK